MFATVGGIPRAEADQMSNFERRLQALHRRPEATPGAESGGGLATAVAAPPTRVATDADAFNIGWLAAERVSHLVDVPAGTTIVMAVDAGDDHAMVEVAWDAEGVPQLREL